MRRLTIPRIAHPPALADFLDGTSRDAHGMVSVQEFTQRSPDDGKPATQHTVAYLGYDDKSFYLVAVCDETEPERIRTRMAKREEIFEDDTILLVLDTFHDGRRAYIFIVNPYGIQADGLLAAGQDDDYSFDAVWHSEGKRTAHGYVVFMAIPFKSLRFSSEPKQTWGIAIGRSNPFRNEQSWWPYVTNRIENMIGQSAILEGLEKISPGRNLQLIPYGFFRNFRELDTINSPPRFVSRAGKFDAGLDAKAVLKDSLVFDVTLNPDFSQVESDEPQVTVNQRFEVFFPEKRPFFLENATFFRMPLNLLFTRRIANPQYGARLTGKAGPYAIGAFFADDRAPGARVPRNNPLFGTRAYNGIARINRDFARESTIGFLFSDCHYQGAFNRVLGPDFRWKLNSNWVLQGQAVASQSRSLDGTRLSGPAYNANLYRQGRSFNYNLEYNDIAATFRTEDGFIPRTDIRRVGQDIRYSYWPKSKTVLTYSPLISMSGVWDHNGVRQDWEISPGFDLELRRQTGFFGGYRFKRELFQGIDFSKRAFIGEFATFALSHVNFRLHFEKGREVNFSPATAQLAFLGGLTLLNFTGTLRPTNRLRIDPTYIFTRLGQLNDHASVFNNHIGRLKVNYQFTPRLSLRTILQYQATLANPSLTAIPTSRRFTGDILLAYFVHPGTVLYVGYSDILDNPDPRFLLSHVPPPPRTRFLETGRQFFVKPESGVKEHGIRL